MTEAREERREGRQLFCRIITPEEMVFDGQANLVVARIADGEIGVLVDHAPVVSAVEFGEVRITEGDEKRIYATSDGFFKVSENLVQVLVEEAIPVAEIDVGEADLVVARIADGEIGVLVDHAPTVSTVEVGEVRITEGDERHIYATSDGFFKVSENLVQVLVEEAIPVEEIDVGEAENRVEEAERDLSEASDEGREEIERRQRVGENLVRGARRYGGEG